MRENKKTPFSKSQWIFLTFLFFFALSIGIISQNQKETEFRLETRCAKKVSGEINLQPENGELVGVLFQNDLSSLTIETLYPEYYRESKEINFFMGMAFSLDRKQLATLVYIDTETTLLQILSFVNDTVTEIELDGSWRSVYWLSPKTVLLIPQDPLQQATILNILTNEFTSFPVPPNNKFNLLYSHIYWVGPQGKAVLYMKSGEAYRSYYGSEQFWIYRFEENSSISTGLNWVHGDVSWSPNGDQIAIASLGELHPTLSKPVHELFIYDLDSQSYQQVSDFLDVLGGAHIETVDWSPNARYILLELDPFEAEQPEIYDKSLYVLDLESNELIDFCLPRNSQYIYDWSVDGELVSWMDTKTAELFIFEVTTARYENFPTLSIFTAIWRKLDTSDG